MGGREFVVVGSPQGCRPSSYAIAPLAQAVRGISIKAMQARLDDDDYMEVVDFVPTAGPTCPSGQSEVMDCELTQDGTHTESDAFAAVPKESAAVPRESDAPAACAAVPRESDAPVASAAVPQEHLWKSRSLVFSTKATFPEILWNNFHDMAKGAAGRKDD